MNQRGMVYLLALGFAFLLTMASASLLMRGVSETSVSQRSGSQHEALHLAEAGLDQAVVNLRVNDTTPIPTTTVPGGTFWAELTPLGSTQTTQVDAHGLASGEQRNVEAVVQLIPQSVFQFALFGAHNVNVSGSAITDSYDSRVGPYNDDAGSPGYNKDHHGDVGTNSTVSGGVAVSGSIFIDGQVAVGPNVPDPTSVVSNYNPAFITGGTSPPSDSQDVLSQSNAFPMPGVTVPSSLTCSDYTVTGNTTVALPAGTYCYRNLTIQGGGTLTAVAGASVTVYLTGALIARGNSVVGVPSDPRKMSFLMGSGGEASLEQGTLTGSTEFYGSLYGPDATLNITGNAEVFGSIIAKAVNLSGSAELHYDTALADVTTPTNSYKTTVVSWQEL